MEGTFTQAELDAAKQAGIADGRKAERSRFAAILGLEEAKGRTTLALSLASESDMEIEAAKRVLSAAPVETKVNPLSAAMADVNNPKVGAGGAADESDAVTAKSVVAAYKAAQGVK